MIDHKVVDDEIFEEGDSFTSVELKVWLKWDKAVVSTKLWMNWDWDGAWEAFVGRVKHGMIKTFLSIVEECGWDDETIAKIMVCRLETMWEVAKNYKHKYVDDDEELSKEETIKKFENLFVK